MASCTFPDGRHILALEDEHSRSRSPDVFLLAKAPSTSDVIQKLQFSFATHSSPDKIVSDNGPQFMSKEMSNFRKDQCGMVHHRITPYWPKANSEVERFF